MKFFVEKNLFSNELKLFQGIFEKKSLIEILQNIKFTLSADGILTMVATDLEIGMKSELSVQTVDPGSFTINGKDLYDLISKMPEGIVEISERNDMNIFISNEEKTCQYLLLGLQASDYPEIPSSSFENPVVLPMEVISNFIYKNYFVLSPDIKFNLGGALFKISGNLLEMVATDGHRLSYTFYPSNDSFFQEKEFIISRKTLLEINKFGETGSLMMDFDNNNLFFKSGIHELSARIIDQKFPNYKSVIPGETKYKATFQKEDLLSSIRRSLIYKTRNNSIFFKFYREKLSLERVTPEKGESRDDVAIEYDGPDIAVAFNGGYVFDFLSHCSSEEIEIAMNDADSSFVFRPKQQDEVNFTYVVMPLNI